MALTDRQRFELNEKIKKNPNVILSILTSRQMDRRKLPDPGRDQVKKHVYEYSGYSEGINAAPEFDVGPYTSIGGMESGPAAT